MSATYSPARDLDELSRMGEQLDEYLLGDNLYMPLGGGIFHARSAPQLTLGAFLLRRRRLGRLRDSLDGKARGRLRAILAAHDELQREWRLHYEAKLRREFDSRMKLLFAYFSECRDEPSACAAGYPVEAMRRSIAQEILLAYDEFDYEASELLPIVRSCDNRLRALLRDSEFIWARQLLPAYPRESFWWLYGRPSA